MKEKVHTTNYKNTFIQVAEDCPVKAAEIPPVKEKKTLANIQYEMISDKPYRFTSDDVLFHCFAVKNDIPKSELKEAREVFFSKGQACFRSSPLTKRYGFGVHSNEDEKIALYPMESKEYKAFSKDKSLKVVKAMKSKR
ncbi:MAG TPA: DUF6157 family protein [Chryseosolibacter sp.]